ncbi:MAG: hypothetical protein IKP06_06000 [Elusimicrobiaceae bacterium]|nr:hypothetical protein [Elusimicrobiaceae bacterium]
MSAPDPADRMELAEAVRREVSKKGYVTDEFLDRFALAHLDPAQDSPTGWDYAALRHTARQEEVNRRKEMQTQSLQQEAVWMTQVGESVADAPSLQAYLKLQIPAYKDRMKAAGIPVEQAETVAKNLQRDMIEKNILRSLSNDDWNTAQQVFSQQKEVFPEGVQQDYSEKIRSTFARFEARRIWQRAQEEAASGQQDAKTVALLLINEPDEDLHQSVQQEITRLADLHNKKQAADKAVLFAQLARADESTLDQLLNMQTSLSPEDVRLARQVILKAQQPATPRQKEWFIEHYFNAEAAHPARAFSQGLCGARDYFRLQALSHRKQSGDELSGDQWLYRGIKSWMEQQGFSAKEINTAAYDVFTGADDKDGRIKIWKKIKTLLTC